MNHWNYHFILHVISEIHRVVGKLGKSKMTLVYSFSANLRRSFLLSHCTTVLIYYDPKGHLINLLIILYQESWFFECLITFSTFCSSPSPSLSRFFYFRRYPYFLIRVPQTANLSRKLCVCRGTMFNYNLRRLNNSDFSLQGGMFPQ